MDNNNSMNNNIISISENDNTYWGIIVKYYKQVIKYYSKTIKYYDKAIKYHTKL